MPNRLKALLITLLIEGGIGLVIFLGVKFSDAVPYVICGIFGLFISSLIYVGVLDALEEK